MSGIQPFQIRGDAADEFRRIAGERRELRKRKPVKNTSDKSLSSRSHR